MSTRNVPVVSIKALSVDNLDVFNVNDAEHKWKDIIFLPFNKYWQTLLVCTIVGHFVLVSYLLVYVDHATSNLLLLFYFFELMFLINTIAVIGHRNMSAHRKTRHHSKTSTFIIVFSVISLLPFYEVMLLLNAYKWDTRETITDYYIKLMDIKCALRIVYSMLFFKNNKQEVGIVHLKYVIFNHLFYYIIITVTFTVFWEILGKQNKPNWTDNLELYLYNRSIPIQGMLLTFHIITGLFTHNWIGVVNGVTPLEKTFVIIILLTGFIFQMMLFYGELTAAFLQLYRHQYEFTTRLTKIMYLLGDWKVKKGVKTRTVEYYKSYWEKRSGINTIPKVFYYMPISLRKEAMVDIFWEALKHSSFFRNVDLSLKRSLSLHMNNEFYLPGDIIFKAGEPKTKMIYVFSGTIQMLTEEDNESPFLQLSAGTLLGEITCLNLHVSKVNVRCDTYCEIQSLDILSLHKVLLEYHYVTGYLRELYQQRIDYAKWATSDAVPKYDVDKEDSERATAVMKLKHQWRYIFSLHSKGKRQDIDWSKIDRSFSSNYLHTLVLTDAVDRNVHAICLTSKCPFVMEPDSSFRCFLNYLIIVCVIIQVTVLPYPVFFLSNISNSVFQLMVILDLLYWLDIYLQLSTAVKVSGSTTLVNPIEIAQYRFKQASFIVDLISALPAYYILALFSVHRRVTLMANVLKLLRITKVFKLITEKEKDIWIDSIYIRSIKYLILSIICAYWAACILYSTACYIDECDPNAWYEYNKVKRNLTDEKKFAKVLFFSVSLLMNINLSDHTFFNIYDIGMSILFFMLSYFLISFTFAELTASAALLFKETYQHQDEIVMFKIIMKRRLVHKQLKIRLLKILEFNWIFNEGAEIQGKNGILSEASTEIRTEIINDRFISCFKLVPLLKDLPENMLEKLSLQAEVIILPPDTYVQNVNVMSHNIYIILRGYCEMNSMLPGDAERDAKVILKRGDILALIETLHRIKIFGSIVSITAIELLSISYEAFIDVFQSYRSEYMFLQNALKEHMQHYESILMRKGCRLPEMKSVKESLGRVKTFQYQTEQKTKVKGRYRKRNSYSDVPKNLGPWTFFRFLLLKRTINPKGTGYIIWEVVRCLCILLETAMSLIYIAIPATYNFIFIITVFRIIGVIDIYIRLHCQYYNNRGIIVKHSLYTALNYLRSSFIIDLASNMPMLWFRKINMYGLHKGREVASLLRIIIRPLALYRVFHGLTYMQRKLHWSNASVLLKIKSTIMVLVILGFLAHVLMVATCDFDSEFNNCTGPEYIKNSIFNNTYQAPLAFLQAFYFNVETFTHSVTGVFGVENDKEITYFLLIECVLYCLRCVILALYTSSGIGGNVNLSTHQARMKQFLAFAKDLLLDENLTKEMVDHCEHVWKETLGTDINVISSKFNLYLRIQFVCFLYETSLRNSELFALAPAAIIQRLTPSLREVHFKRGATIIRCNDVQRNLYFVHKGEVDITVANTVLTTLRIGGMFGCFHKGGMVRQTFTAIGRTHTILLALDSIKIQELILEWDDKQSDEMLKQIRLMNVEYLEPHVVYSSTCYSHDGKQGESRYDKIIKKFNRYVDIKNFWYWLFEYFLNVHLAALTSICDMAVICIYLNKTLPNTFLILFYITDAIFYFKIFLGFHLAYVEPSSGLLILKAKRIMMRYLETNFALDLLTCLPMEMVAQYFVEQYKLFGLNRVGRFLFMVNYYHACKQRLILSKHLRWSYLIYWTMFRLQLMASIWFFFSCMHNNCHFVEERFGRPKTVIQTYDMTDSALVGYSYTVNVFTTTGMRDTVPMNWKELLASTVMALFAQFMIANMASGFANMVIIEDNTMANYQHKINKLRIYLTGRHLSPALLKKVWEYYILLWKLQKGECLPRLITEAPSYLKQDVMLHLFGYHLENHPLFAKTHKDFLRQLVTLFERRLYLPGNVIVEKGDVDNTMYFVHSGEVGAFDKYGTNEVQCYVLHSDMSFGEEQGLHDIPYRMTYKALTVTFILALRRSVWKYLLEWFPASQQTIMEKASELFSDDTHSTWHL